MTYRRLLLTLGHARRFTETVLDEWIPMPADDEPDAQFIRTIHREIAQQAGPGAKGEIGDADHTELLLADHRLEAAPHLFIDQHARQPAPAQRLGPEGIASLAAALKVAIQVS